MIWGEALFRITLANLRMVLDDKVFLTPKETLKEENNEPVARYRKRSNLQSRRYRPWSSSVVRVSVVFFEIADQEKHNNRYFLKRILSESLSRIFLKTKNSTPNTVWAIKMVRVTGWLLQLWNKKGWNLQDKKTRVDYSNFKMGCCGLEIHEVSAILDVLLNRQPLSSRNEMKAKAEKLFITWPNKFDNWKAVQDSYKRFLSKNFRSKKLTNLATNFVKELELESLRAKVVCNLIRLFLETHFLDKVVRRLRKWGSIK